MSIAALFYIAFLILAYGLVSKIIQYKNTPAPLKIPTMPAPTTQAGVVFRMSKEVVFFESFFKSSKATWLFGWLFHFGLFLDMLRHLRYFIDPVWFWVINNSAIWKIWIYINVCWISWVINKKNYC
jgi:nitrate reductase gamma subunit